MLSPADQRPAPSLGWEPRTKRTICKCHWGGGDTVRFGMPGMDLHAGSPRSLHRKRVDIWVCMM